MNKYISATILLFILIIPSHAQKYKVKKNIVYRDKQKVGQVVAVEHKWSKPFTVVGLNDEEVMRVSHRKFQPDNPFFNPIYWYEITFTDTQRTLNLPYGGDCKPDCVLKTIMKFFNLDFQGSYIQNQDEVASEHDISKKLHMDSMKIVTEHETMTRLIKENEVLRDKYKPIRIIPQVRNPNTSATGTQKLYDVVQDNALIGTIIKFQRTAPYHGDISYDIYEVLYEPAHDRDEVALARVTSILGTTIEFRTVIDNKEHRIRSSDIYNAENELASYLVEKGYL